MELLKKRGPKVNQKIADKIIEILRELKIATPEMVRMTYKDRYKIGLGWNTADKRLKALALKGAVSQKVLNKGVRRTTAVYSTENN